MHVAIIMDGNGRWATQRGLPRTAGHRAGAKAVDVVVQAAVRAKIGTLTLYAFSAANWTRPRPEVAALFALLRRYLTTQTPRCLEQSIRIEIIGRRDRLSPQLVQTIERSERATAQVDHSSLATPDVDLLIRTGGEKRLSDFLLWECAYAELHFVENYWPDFDSNAFDQALHTYSHRQRRFGQVAPPMAVAAN
jgi:undecaprenyl diphosphate synthase